MTEDGSLPFGDARLEANRGARDARVPPHAASRFYDVEARLRDKQGPRPWEVEALGDAHRDNGGYGIRPGARPCPRAGKPLETDDAAVSGRTFSAPLSLIV